jgi:ABC-type multidrug transport system fused ATPase/permease subunit
MLMVELVATAARALESQLRARCMSLMSKSLQVRMFESLISKDMAWWANQKEQWRLIMDVWNIPTQLEHALMTPLTLINRISSICVQASLVRQNSSSMLRAMVALHWARFLAKKALSWMEVRLTRKATSGIVMPSEDKFTWPFALQAENIQMYQSFARGPKEALSLGKFLHAFTKSNAISGSIRSLCDPLYSLVAQGGSIAEFASMGQLIQEGSLDITQAETMMHYATETASEMEGAYQDASSAQDKLVPLAKAYDYIDIPAKIPLDVGFEPGKRATGHFVFNNVCFRYPGKKSELLKGVSFEVKPGQTVGITGSSGCGKSTCLRLVERFYDVTGGQIMLDGRDIRDYKPQWLRSQIVAVEQEPKLLPVAIRENLAFGCDHDPTLEEIEKACRAANIWDALQDPQKFPNGLETKIEAVQNVSGGEKQRLCIARAILADPPILLLDEATSTLDEISQADVQTALNKLMQGRTTLVVAHRLSTIKDSDKIIGMRDGRVVDDGTHEELLAKEDGVWKQLWLKQGASDDASSPVASVEAKLPPPTLQRSTSVVGKFELLRQVVGALSADERRVAIDIIGELEAQASEWACGVRELEGMSPADELVRRLSRATTAALSPTLGAKGHWAKVRGMAHMGVLKARTATLQRAKTWTVE